MRFRWYQGYYHPKETSIAWGLDNLYIGPGCTKHYQGHGYCLNGDVCICDEGHDEGETCNPEKEFPKELHENFEGITCLYFFLIFKIKYATFTFLSF